jgi:methionine-rich copper-binding protein CopC
MATTSDVNSVTYSNDFRVNSLLDNSVDWNFLLPTRTTLYYTFDVTPLEAARHVGTTVFNTAQKDAARALMSYVSSVTGVSFAEVANSAAADFHFAACNITSSASTSGLAETVESWSYTSGIAGNTLTSYTAEAYVYLDNVEFAGVNTTPVPGSVGYEILLHEIGHALGLGHPFEGLYPLLEANDNTNNTVMSYTKIGPIKSTFQPYDLLALRWIYGQDGLRGTWGLNSANGPSLTLAAPADNVPPTVSSFSPANASVGVAVSANIVITFSENIQRGAGTVVVKTAANAVVASYDVASSGNLSISGNMLTINPTTNLNYGTGYKLELSPGAVQDLAGNAYAGTTTYNFSTELKTNTMPTGAVNIAGVASQGQSLTASNTLADADGLGLISYQWRAGGIDIAGATGNVLVLAQAQVGKTITVLASYNATATVANVNDLPTGTVTINGTALQGQALTVSNTLADADGLGAISYQWKVGGVAVAGATGNSFVLSQAQVGRSVPVQASYTDVGGTAESVSSSLTAAVASRLANTVGTEGNDLLSTQALNSGLNTTFVGLGGNDRIVGGAGKDISAYSAVLSNYTVTKTSTGYIVTDKTGTDGSDTLTSIEALSFSDKSINLQIQAQAALAPAADVVRLTELYVAFFNRIPDADGLSYWIGQKTGGLSVDQIAESFYSAGVQFSSLTGFSSTMTNVAFVNVVYKNVLGRPDGADAQGLAYWSGKLADGSASRGALVSTILDSAHTYKGDASFGFVADLLDNKITVAKTAAIDYGLNYNSVNEAVSNGMAIAAAVTPGSIASAIALVGVNGFDLQLV